MWNRKDLKKQGKEAVKRNYWKAVLTSFIAVMLFGGVGTVSFTIAQHPNMQGKFDELQKGLSELSIGILIAIFAALAVVALLAIACIEALRAALINPLEVGISKFQINAVKDKGNISDLGTGFDSAYKRNVGTLFLRDLYIVLWCLLFVVPGLIKLYEYRMIPYLLADNPDMSRKEAFAKSKTMMYGKKWRAFVLDISFILWDILGAVTFGIVDVLYVLPYRFLTSAALYETLKGDPATEADTCAES